MTGKTFTELLRGANETLAHVQGKRNLHMTTLRFPPKSLNGGAAGRLGPPRYARTQRSARV